MVMAINGQKQITTNNKKETIMKLHIINKVLGVGLAALLLTACTDKNDWSVDSSKDRLFSVSSSDISIERDMTEATITFKIAKGATNYKLELSTEELNDNVAEGATAGSMIYLYDAKEAVESKITAKITGLKKDTRYWLRIRSVSEGKTPSNWTYYKDSKNNTYFKTKAEQLFNTYTYFATKTINPKNLKEDEVILTWKADEGSTAAAVTHLLLTVNGSEQSITIDDTEKEARKKTLKYGDYGIVAGSSFNVKLYNSDDKRGEFTLTAPAARPAGLHELDEDAGETIEGLITSGSGDIIIGIPASTAETTADDQITIPNITIPSTVTSVTLYGLAGGANRCINFSGTIKWDGNLTKLRFENLELSSPSEKSIIDMTGISNESTVDAVEFENILFPNLKKACAIRLRNTGVNTTVKKLYMNQVYVQQQTGIQFIYTKDTNQAIDEIEIKNSTFSNMNHTFIDVNDPAKCTKITVSDCTFYNCIGSGRYFVNAKNIVPAPSIEMYRTIFAKSNAATVRGIQAKGVVNAEVYNFPTCYMTSDFVFETKKNDAGADVPQFPFFVGNNISSSTKIMKAPKEGNFTLTVSIEGGDPRWIEPTED